jgi:hypothetical protein
VTEQKLGEILDGLGVSIDLDEGDLVSSAVVLCKVIKADGTVTLGYAQSDGMCWIEAVGMLTAGSDVARQGYTDDE